MTKTKLSLTVCVAVILLFAGCRSADGPPFDPLDSYSGSKTLVFIYRPTPVLALGGGLAPDIIIDGEKITDLRSMGYTRVFLRQGPHVLQVKRFNLDKDKRESKYEFTIPENTKRCFLRVAVPQNSLSETVLVFTINALFSLATKTYTPIIGENGCGFDANFIDPAGAVEEIKNCRYITPDVDAL
jgi:hypothetical protein